MYASFFDFGAVSSPTSHRKKVILAYVRKVFLCLRICLFVDFEVAGRNRGGTSGGTGGRPGGRPWVLHAFNKMLIPYYFAFSY